MSTSSTPLASLAAIHGHGFILPKKVNDQTHTLCSTSWVPEAFGLKVKVSCNICKYLENITIRQSSDSDCDKDSDSGKWRKDKHFRQNRNHHKYCNLLLKQKHLAICKLLCGPDPTPVDYSEFNNRLKSFKPASWKNHPTNKNKDINALAENGLFYLGEDDHVMCFSCHTSLRNWKSLDYRTAHAERSTQSCTFLKTHKEPEIWEAARHFLESNQLDEFICCIKQEIDSNRPHTELTKLAKRAIESGKIQFLDPILTNSDLAFDTVTVDNQETGIIIFAITCMQAAALKKLLTSKNVAHESESNRYQITDDGERWPRLCLAITRKRIDMVRILIEHGDDPAISNLHTNPAKSSQPRNINPHTDNSDIQSQGKKKLTHWTSWEYSLYSGKTSAFKYMIKNGLKSTPLTDTGEQPIHIAAKVNNTEAIKLLIKEGANINALTQSAENNQKNTASPGPSGTSGKRSTTPSEKEPVTGFTPSFYAAMFQSSISYEWLIQHGADPTPSSTKGTTADHYRLDPHRQAFAQDEKKPDYFQVKFNQSLIDYRNKLKKQD